MTATDLPLEVMAAYAAPFPEERYAAGARQFPLLVPTAPDDEASAACRAAWTVLEGWHKPFLTAFSDLDPAFGGRRLKALTPVVCPSTATSRSMSRARAASSTPRSLEPAISSRKTKVRSLQQWL
jgi:hypothetical protein